MILCAFLQQCILFMFWQKWYNDKTNYSPDSYLKGNRISSSFFMFLTALIINTKYLSRLTTQKGSNFAFSFSFFNFVFDFFFLQVVHTYRCLIMLQEKLFITLSTSRAFGICRIYKRTYKRYPRTSV